MTADEQDTYDTVTELVAEEGRTITLYSGPAAALDGSKPWRGPRASGGTAAGTTTDVAAVFITDGEQDQLRVLMGQAVRSNVPVPPRRGKASFLVAGSSIASIEPSEVTAIIDGTQEWRVTSVEEIRPGNVLYGAIFGVDQ